MQDLEVWGGVECTVNRVRDCWHDQMELSGHAQRLDDLHLIAQLGVRTLRYPVLWERVAPRSLEELDWQWADERLNTLRALSIAPIVGLLHHGSGPRYTDLLDRDFPRKFAQFAGAVAGRYPWVNRYTPINEPMTTARFSALYGHWYPHHRDDRSFARVFINQCRGIALAMAAIRRVNPRAELVQTEDLGTTYSSSHMEYQKRFDNERRWLTWDILTGRVDRRHPLRLFLESCGVLAEELDWFTRNPCPPQLVGINHYVTSDRYLDERTRLYPPRTHGGNAREAYADIEAVRVIPGDHDSWKIIRTAAARYQLPMALTEVHIGCTREEQLRWFNEAYAAASAAKRTGCDVRAVTAWSLFGSYNWDKLLTQTNGSYEPGAFDIRAPRPRATAVARLIQQTVAALQEPLEPQFQAAGWWRRDSRTLHGPVKSSPPLHPHPGRVPHERSHPLLITGAKGILGQAIIEECEKRSLSYIALTRSELDIADPQAVRKSCDEMRPWAIVNAAGYVQVDQAERNILQCYRDNVEGPRVLAEAADERQIRFVTFSSDLVFDGCLAAPYLESNAAAPLNVYGQSKFDSEAATLRHSRTLCVRTAAFFGAWNGSDFLSEALATLRQGRPYVAIEDITVSPTYLPDLATASLDLLIDGCSGLVHLVNRGALTWASFLEQGAAAVGVSVNTLRRNPAVQLRLDAPRPAYSALSSERVHVMPSLENAIERYAMAYRRQEIESRDAYSMA